MVARVVDIREYRRGKRSVAEVVCEVSHVVDGDIVTEVLPSIMLDRSVLDNDAAFIQELSRFVRSAYATNRASRFVGMEFTVDG